MSFLSNKQPYVLIKKRIFQTYDEKPTPLENFFNSPAARRNPSISVPGEALFVV
jgi:hypothetical protein